MITKTNRKALDIKYSGRSSDWITPSFDFGCLAKCAYCYMRRHNPKGVSLATNDKEILNAVIKHHNKLKNKKILIKHLQNNNNLKKAHSLLQTHSELWTYDIGCNHDVALHWKYRNYHYILDTLIGNNIFPTFATKFVNKKLLNYNPKYKARIRFSLMPQELSTILEPNTTLINDRIDAVNEFFNNGWDVHLNFSPVIINKGTKTLYNELFKEVDKRVSPGIKRFVKSEIIMLTHNEKMHSLNLIENPKAEKILWQPNRQENKITSYKSKAIRYNRYMKSKYIKSFKELHKSIIPWNEIRYIF